MGPPPAPEDRARILELAEQGVSARQISQLTGWSRPTVSKILRLEGGHDSRRKPPRKVEKPAPTFDLAEEMRKCDEETLRYWQSLSEETKRKYWEIEHQQQVNGPRKGLGWPS